MHIFHIFKRLKCIMYCQVLALCFSSTSWTSSNRCEELYSLAVEEYESRPQLTLSDFKQLSDFFRNLDKPANLAKWNSVDQYLRVNKLNYHLEAEPRSHNLQIQGFFENSNAKLGDIAIFDEKIALFRVIDGSEYLNNFKYKGSTLSEGGLAYSLNPTINRIWGGSLVKTVLISLQSLSEHNLRWPGYPEMDYFFIENREDPLKKTFTYKNVVNPNTRIYQPGPLHEVKVPVRYENVVAIIPEDKYQLILEKFGNNYFNILQLLQAVFESPFVRSPTEYHN